MTSRHLIPSLLLLVMSTGCADSVEPQTAQPKQSAKLKTTDDIGEFKADDGKQTVSSKVKISNPITGALEAYAPMKQQLGELKIKQSVDFFNASEGRYPKDHEEFMTKVIKANNIRLPALGPGKQYQYDVQNHALMVVTESAAE
ncbi:MAG: hypothetical protein GY903_11250 [Fuerstiella sp.]|nr:hypothetical protein [Fuerstiella sp.]MCP4855058.1 hypothetical protein [Fuerstiella sp.]